MDYTRPTSARSRAWPTAGTSPTLADLLQEIGSLASPTAAPIYFADVGGWPPRATVSGPEPRGAAGLVVALTSAAITLPAALASIFAEDPATRERAAAVAALGAFGLLTGVGITLATSSPKAEPFPAPSPLAFPWALP